MKNIELVAIDDKPIKRRVFMKDYSGPERRKNPKRDFEFAENCVVTVLCAAGLALMFFYMG